MNDIANLETEKLLPDNLPQDITEYINEYRTTLGDGTRRYEGLETGMTAVDELLGGLNRFVLIAGMAGVGKSTLAIQLALGVIAKEKIPVIYYSYEMAKRDVITLAVQNTSRKLFRGDIELRGNANNLEETKRHEIDNSLSCLQTLPGRFYILDSSSGASSLDQMKEHIKSVKSVNGSERILVVIDSIQDIVAQQANQTQAEVQAAQKLVEIQQETGATILGIAQKNKAGVLNGGGYGSVMGSVAWIHKPTTVIELTGGQEALRILKEKDSKISNDFESVINYQALNPDSPYPVLLNVIKGRNSGNGGLFLGYFGAYRYYKVMGKEKKEACKSLFQDAAEIFSSGK